MNEDFEGILWNGVQWMKTLIQRNRKYVEAWEALRTYFYEFHLFFFHFLHLKYSYSFHELEGYNLSEEEKSHEIEAHERRKGRLFFPP